MSTKAKEVTGRRRRRRRTTKRSPFVLVGQAGAVVGLITGLLSLVFIARPGCAPKAPPDTGTGQISDVRVVSPVTFKRFLQHMNVGTGTMSREQLRRVGVLVQFHYELKGFAAQKLPLRWELNDARSNDRVAEDSAITIRPSTNDEGRTWFMWVPTPKTRRTYYIVGTIYQPGGAVPVQDFRSPDFRGLGTSS
jgi:hypothetical protein